MSQTKGWQKIPLLPHFTGESGLRETEGLGQGHEHRAPPPCWLVAEPPSPFTDLPGPPSRCHRTLSPLAANLPFTPPRPAVWERVVSPAAFLKLSPHFQAALSCINFLPPSAVTAYLALVIGLFIVILQSVLESVEGHGAKYNSITS